MTIDEALERFLVQLAADGRSEHTIGQYRRHIRLLAAWAREVRLYARCQDVLVVKEALCHRSIASTLVYARVDEGRLRRAL